MRIQYRSGDLIDAAEAVILHGCNAQGRMGAGVAKAVRERLPFAYLAYREAYLVRGLRLGEVIWAVDLAPARRARMIANAVTQQDYGPGDRRYVDDEAIRLAIREVDRFAELSQTGMLDLPGITPITTVAMPRIGSGLGGGEWSAIAPIIEQESSHFQPVVYVLEAVR